MMKKILITVCVFIMFLGVVYAENVATHKDSGSSQEKRNETMHGGDGASKKMQKIGKGKFKVKKIPIPEVRGIK